MSEEVITVTEAARNFADCVNRARYQGTSFVLHRNGEPVARIVPVSGGKKKTHPGNGRELAQAFREARKESGLTSEDADLWLQELQAARAALLPVRDKWQD
jgi:prevent-host-death family protein